MNSSIEQYKNLNPRHKKFILISIIGVLIIVLCSIGVGMSENELISDKESIIITGVYGEIIPITELKSIELTDVRPSLIERINGFSMGNWKKGYFKTAEGEKVKCFINSGARPWILITTLNGDKIYYSSARQDNESLLNKLTETLPNNAYN